ncbi:MAG TPA: HesA/MoeB/ThiF family protein [Sphingobacteriaceae bacterium]|nr:HesA/MoeB/ThiF family protein [Sphingobacteriaceae bacterium]
MLTREELRQYNRQIILPEFGIQGQEKLKAAKVLMIGAGGLGCPVLQYLVAAGVGTIGIVDDDVVDVSNLHRQILYSVANVGSPKAVTAKHKLELLNPFVAITSYQERLTSYNGPRLVEMYDLIIDGSDNFPTRYLVNDTCMALNKPLIFGSIFKFEGQVSVFNYQEGPNYRDVFPEPPPADEMPNCAEIGVIGVLPGIIGLYMANEAIKVICNIGETLSGKLMTVDALDNSVTIFKINKTLNDKPDTVKVNLRTDKPALNLEINADELTNWLEQNPENVYIIDVRENYEFEEYNIGGINIPLYELMEQIDTIPIDKKLVFCCQTGQRSKMAIQLLTSIYRGEMYSLKNGIR